MHPTSAQSRGSDGDLRSGIFIPRYKARVGRECPWGESQCAQPATGLPRARRPVSFSVVTSLPMFGVCPGGVRATGQHGRAKNLELFLLVEFMQFIEKVE